MKKIKVLWLAPYPLNAIQNIPVKYRKRNEHPSTWIVTLSEALSQLPNIDLHIISQRSDIAVGFDCCQNNIHFHFVKTSSTIPFLPFGYSWLIPYDVLKGFKKDRKILLKKIKEINPDIIHAHGTETPYSITAVESGYPHLISLQGIINELVKLSPNFRFRKLAQLEREVLQKGESFIAKTNFAARLVREVNQGAAIYHIDNIVHPAFFQVKRNGSPKKMIVYAGSINPSKGTKEIIIAFENFTREFPEYRLNMVGSGPIAYIEELKELADTLKIADKINWRGFLSHQQIADIFKAAKVLVFPSKMDTSPNIVAEAMVSGLPVIASRAGGIPDMVTHKHTGYLVEEIDARLIYSALKLLATDETLYKHLESTAGREARIRFSSQNNVEKVLNAYQDILNRKGKTL